MALDNDTRGWIMTVISGIACCIGASVICIDVIVRLFPGMHDFKISESDAFLSASLSLSFGVMLYSALYSMLPQSKDYLKDAGYSPQAAGFLLIGLFLVGVIGIKLLSGIIHRFIPSHVVDCDHTHDEEHGKDHGLDDDDARDQTQDDEDDTTKKQPHDTEGTTENTPLLSQRNSATAPPQRMHSEPPMIQTQDAGFITAPSSRRPSGVKRSLTRTLSKYVHGRKESCDETGPCMGFSDPCGQDCFSVLHKRASIGAPGHVRNSIWGRTASDYHLAEPVPEEVGEEPQSSEQQPSHDSGRSRSFTGRGTNHVTRSHSATHHYHHPEHTHDTQKQPRGVSVHSQKASTTAEHHHHVPTNAFMAIGLQTSLAIALHKAPEGFITYATNHANPTLGFAVFMALFIHNITEGYAMSLPLYLALNSRFKAILWSSFLGGVSQPLGAGVAALWFKVAQKSGHGAPNEAVYGCMFAITSGVMTSVALSLFSESIQLSHNKGTCIAFAFLGMAILGVSFALTAK